MPPWLERYSSRPPKGGRNPRVADGWTHETDSAHTAECHSALEEEGAPTRVRMWGTLEDLALSEVSPSRKDRHRMTPRLRGPGSRQTQRGTKQKAGGQGWGARGGGEFPFCITKSSSEGRDNGRTAAWTLFIPPNCPLQYDTAIHFTWCVCHRNFENWGEEKSTHFGQANSGPNALRQQGALERRPPGPPRAGPGLCRRLGGPGHSRVCSAALLYR